jgi:hypothetical protein
MNSRLWIVLIAEHVLLLIKVSVASFYFLVRLITPLQVVLTAVLPTIDEKVMYDHEASM